MGGWLSGDGQQPTRDFLQQEEVLVGLEYENEARVIQGGRQAMQLTPHFPSSNSVDLEFAS